MRRLLAALPLLAACATAGGAPPEAAVPDRFEPKPYVKVQHPEWSRDAVVYQINTRQFTEEGTFQAAREHLPRLEALGVDILWLMPVHPIGEDRRKGMLGSPYSVRDYYGVNPEFGTHDDLRAFIDDAHARGMHVILDWVANHTAWDNPLRTAHPEWYETDAEGENEHTPYTDWEDIVDLDYSEPTLRAYMTEVMRWWVDEMGVDGFRADVAGFVPLGFWETLRTELDAVKPVFMLAEWDTRDLHARAFDATYAWTWKDAMQASARGGGAGPIRGYYYVHANAWPEDAYRLLYTSNHDQNAWDGPAPEIYGDAYEAMIALSFTAEGLPMIYNGQEAGLDRKLAFFEKDEIEWRDDLKADLFAELIALRTEEEALHSGTAGARLEPVPNTDEARVFSFARLKDGNGVLAVFNLSDAPVEVTLGGSFHQGAYMDWRTGEAVAVGAGHDVALPAWGYAILRRSP
jgi:glycosidase